ncbi:MAG: hypothetical protein CVU38_01565 [Chloroflexi bacterium HGW-Chloroflexi-1]|nr:MAG: hypothetical protein CVU38_01565 [Chloroflexi bacterium HGW-Chloroflexi-1]
MPSPFALFWRAIKQWWGDIYAFWLANLIWTLGALLVVTAPPAAAALNALTRQTAQDETVQWAQFLRQQFLRQQFLRQQFLRQQFLRQQFLRQQFFWGLTLLDGFILLLIAANYQFWGHFIDGWARWIQSFWGAAFLVWLLWQLYLYPALVVQARPNVFRAMRNALLLMVNDPLRTVGLGLLCLALLTASVGVVFPIFMATPAVIAIACNGAYLAYTGGMDRHPERAAPPARRRRSDKA